MTDEARGLLREGWEMIDYLRTEANLQYGRGLQKRILKFLAQSKAAQVAVPIGKPVEQSIADQPVGSNAAPASGEKEGLVERLLETADSLISDEPLHAFTVIAAQAVMREAASTLSLREKREGMVVSGTTVAIIAQVLRNRKDDQASSESERNALSELETLLAAAPSEGGEEKIAMKGMR